MSAQTGQPGQRTEARQNVWLTALGMLTPLLLLAGVIMYGAGVSEGGDPRWQLIGAELVGAGIVAGAVLLAAGAICWQLRSRG